MPDRVVCREVNYGKKLLRNNGKGNPYIHQMFERICFELEIEISCRQAHSMQNFQGKRVNPAVYKNVGPLKLLQLYKQCVTGDLDT